MSDIHIPTMHDFLPGIEKVLDQKKQENLEIIAECERIRDGLPKELRKIYDAWTALMKDRYIRSRGLFGIAMSEVGAEIALGRVKIPDDTQEPKL